MTSSSFDKSASGQDAASIIQQVVKQSVQDDGKLSDNQATSQKDTLLECLICVARHHNLHVSSGAILSGLPLEDGRLTPGTFARAASRVGLTTSIVRQPLSALTDFVMPAILLMKGRSSCIVFARVDDGYEVYSPEMGEERFIMRKADLEKSYTGQAILSKPVVRAQAKEQVASDAYSGHWFWGAIKGLWPQYSQMILASFLVNSLAIATPLYMLNVYDRVLPNSAFSTLWVLSIGMFLVLAFDLILRALRGFIIDRAGRVADVTLASRIFDHVLRIRLKERPAASGAFASRLRDFESVREFFSSATILAIIDIAFIVLFLGVIYMVGGPLVYIPIAAVIVVVLAGIVVQPFMVSSIRSVQEETAQKHGLLIETITGLSTIKSLNAEGAVLKQWEGLVDVTARRTEQVRAYSMNMINFTMIVQQFVTIGIVIYGSYLFDDGLVSMGAIIATVLLASRAVAPLGMIAGTFSRLQQSLVALKSLNGIMQTGYENQDVDLQVSHKITEGEIEFKNVTFTYPEAKEPALKDVSFHIKPGDKIGIIGKVGAGKSTLSQIIANLYQPDEGSVLIDGMNVAQLHTSDLRASMGIVMQDVVLFRGSARENIAFGKPTATDAEIKRAARLSGASEFIDNHPMGYSLEVGERGQFLSGGQRQFIALARALLNDPAIIILDEPTSAMDNVSEGHFLKRLKAATQSKTLILSTHRQSLLAIVDKLMVVDNGRVVKFGPKQDVLGSLQKLIKTESVAKPIPKSRQTLNIKPVDEGAA